MKRLYLKTWFILCSMLFVVTLVFGQKPIIFVGAGASAYDYAFDAQMIDSLESWDYSVEYWDDDQFRDTPITWTNYGGVFISETVGSGTIKDFGATHNYPVPAVCLEGWAINPDRWAWVSTAAQYKEQSAGSEDELFIVISDNSHYITQDYKVGDEVQWSTNTGDDLSSIKLRSVSEVNVAFSSKLAKTRALASEEKFWAMVTVDDKTVIPTRMFWWGLNQWALNGSTLTDNYGTEDLFKILKRAGEWAFLGASEVSVKEITNGTKLSVYPNPIKEVLNVHFNSEVNSTAQIILYNATGKIVDILYDGQACIGANVATINIEKFAAGLYFIELKSGKTKEVTKVIFR